MASNQSSFASIAASSPASRSSPTSWRVGPTARFGTRSPVSDRSRVTTSAVSSRASDGIPVRSFLSAWAGHCAPTWSLELLTSLRMELASRLPATRPDSGPACLAAAAGAADAPRQRDSHPGFPPPPPPRQGMATLEPPRHHRCLYPIGYKRPTVVAHRDAGAIQSTGRRRDGT